MLWVINGLIYGFFTAVYMLFNQHFKVDGYVLGIWRGFGICLLFLPFVFLYPVPSSLFYWCILILQGICIGIYDSHIFYASADFGAGPTSRFMAVTVLLTTFMWWALTPEKFLLLFKDSDLLLTLLLVLCGFSFCYWQMWQSEVSRQAAIYTFPAVLALAVMSIATKYIAEGGSSLGQGLIYYLSVSTFVSGVYNLGGYRLKYKNSGPAVLSAKMLKIGVLLVIFSAILIVAKTMALRVAPNPGYVTALLLIAPLFIGVLNYHYKTADKVLPEAGFAMIFFLILLVFLVNGNFGITE
ncbi:MAG: hypothetical protein J6039_05690 [Alphaproteobacteria bacterium]|nr:hypothetical protein [Alphaproteobacteria bacterium]